MKDEIKETRENDKIIADMLALEIKTAQHRKSLNRVCEDLGIDVIGGKDE